MKTILLGTGNLVNRRYQLIMFDFDGTLCRTELADIRAIQKTYQALQQPIPGTEAIRSTLTRGLIARGIIENLSPDTSPLVREQLLSTYKELYLLEAGTAELFPEVITVLEKLKAAQVAMIIVSNKSISLLKAACTTLKINHYFDMVIGLRENHPCKPDPMLYQLEIQPHFPDIKQEGTLMIGDTETDLAFAKAISVDAAWCAYGGADANACSYFQPKYTLKAPADLLAVL